MNANNDHGPQHVTPEDQSVLKDLFAEEEAVELQVRGELLRGLQDWLRASDRSQSEVGKQLGITQARVSDIKRGNISSFSLDLLLKIAVRAGLQPRLELVA